MKRYDTVGQRRGERPDANRFICPRCRAALVVFEVIGDPPVSTRDLMAHCRLCGARWTDVSWRVLHPAPVNY